MPVELGRIRLLVKASGNLGGARLSLGHPPSISPPRPSSPASAGPAASASSAVRRIGISCRSTPRKPTYRHGIFAILFSARGSVSPARHRRVSSSRIFRSSGSSSATQVLSRARRRLRLPRRAGHEISPPPGGKAPLWHRADDASDFDAINLPDPAPRVRIAHFDTGFDPNPNHVGRPKFLRTDLGRNFVDGDFPNDATDRS